MQITCGSEYSYAIRRVSLIQPSLFYFSLRILFNSEWNKPFFPTPKFRQQLDSKGKARIVPVRNRTRVVRLGAQCTDHWTTGQSRAVGVPAVQLTTHVKSSTLYGRLYGRRSKFFRFDGLLLPFCIVMGLRSASSAITAFYTCDVSHHVTCIGTFSKWPSIKCQKKFAHFFCSFRILKPKKSVLAKKREDRSIFLPQSIKTNCLNLNF